MWAWSFLPSFGSCIATSATMPRLTSSTRANAVTSSRKQRRELVTAFARVELVSLGMVADVAIHEPKEGKNDHAHILTTLRPLDGEGFGQKKARDWDKKELLLHLRQAWADAVNGAMAAAGLPGRVDHRSLVDQGIDRIPQ